MISRLFTAGVGSFHVQEAKSSSHKNGVRLGLVFSLTQHTRETELVKSLVEYLDCGRYHAALGRDCGVFVVTRLSGITEKIIPFDCFFPSPPGCGARFFII